MCGSIVYIKSAMAEIRQGKKERKIEETTAKIFHRAAIIIKCKSD